MSDTDKLTLYQRLAFWLNDAWFWLVGGKCPFCGSWESGWWGRPCPKLAALSPAEVVRQCSSKVREILDDEPADKFVHSALEACETLEEAFSVKEARDGG